MKKIKFLMILGVSIILIFLTNKTFAANTEISILEYNQKEYVLYIKELLDKDFKYAFSDNNSTEEKDLNYITSKKDSEGNSLIFLDKLEYQKFNGKDIYIWVKNGDNNIVNAQKLDFNNSISRDEIVSLENLTKLIDIKTDKQIEINTVENGIQKNKKLGTIQFNNTKNKYYYQLLKVEDNQNYQKLFEIVEKINNDYSKINIVEKINILKELKNIYGKIIQNINLQEVKDFKIIEPEDTITGQKYIAIIQELGETETFDIQLLNSSREYNEKYITEEEKDENNTIDNNIIATDNNVTTNTSKPLSLPITYDSKILIIIIAVIFAAIVFTWMRYKNLEKKSKNEK